MINENKKVFRFILFLIFVFSLSACGAAPTRQDADSFKLINEAVIPEESTQNFTDCLMDGFNDSHWMLTNVSVKQQRRSDSYRVEAFTGTILLVSADVFDDGRVRLLESTSASLINTTGERDSFVKCLNLYGISSSDDQK